MAITVVNSTTAASATPTMPAGAVSGDLIVVFAYNTASTTLPTLPTSWTSLTTGSLTSVAVRVSQRLYDGVWTMAAHTTANRTHAIALRGAVTTIGTANTGTGSTIDVTWAAYTGLGTAGTTSVSLRGAVNVRPDAVMAGPTPWVTLQAEGTAPGTMTSWAEVTSPGAGVSTTARASAWVAPQVEIRAAVVAVVERPRARRQLLQAVNRAGTY